MLCISDSECVTKMTPYSFITVYREMIALPFYYRPFACIISGKIILLFNLLENNTLVWMNFGWGQIICLCEMAENNIEQKYPGVQYV